MASAEKYLLQAIGETKKKLMFDFNDFLAVFIKGIFRDVVSGIASAVQRYKRKDQEQVDENQSLLWKLSDYKREKLFDMVSEGMIKTHTDTQ